MNKSKIFINVFSSGAQVVFTGFVYFVLYKLLLERLGIERLGVWSIVLSTSSLANLANFGVSSSVTRFVSSFSKNGGIEKIKQLIFTSALFLCVIFSLLAIIVFPFAEFFLEKIIDEKYTSEAVSILPFSILCLIINAIAGVYSSVLEGLQKNYIKSTILSLSSLILLGGAYFFTSNSSGLKGIAVTQVIQSLFSLLVSVLFVLKILPHNPLKWRWNKPIFKEIFSYGTKFQLISISAMLNDPLTKILLAKFGGLQFAGYYEMANRLVSQFRGVIVSANQSLIPVFVHLDDQSDKMHELYKKTFTIVYIISLVTLTSVFLSSTSISILWIGKKESVFVFTLALLCIGYFFNLLSGPAYFSEMASGKLNILLKTHFILCALNALLGFSLGILIGGNGIIIGWMISLILSSVYLISSHHKTHQIKIVFYRDRIIPTGLLLTITIVSVHLFVWSIFSFNGIFSSICVEAILIFLFISLFILISRKSLLSIIKQS